MHPPNSRTFFTASGTAGWTGRAVVSPEGVWHGVWRGKERGEEERFAMSVNVLTRLNTVFTNGELYELDVGSSGLQGVFEEVLFESTDGVDGVT